MVERADPGNLTTPIPADVKIVWLPYFRSKWHLLAILPKMLSALWRPVRKADALLINIPSFPALPALLVARLLRKPALSLMVARWAQLRKEKEEGLLQRVTSSLSTNAVALLSTRLLIHGDPLLDEVWRPLRGKAVPVVLSGLTDEDIGPLKPTSRLGRAHPTLLCVARFIRTKRIDVAIAAVSVLRERGIKTRLIIAGDGRERQNLEQLVDKLSLQEDIEFLGWVDDPPRLRRLYRDAFAVVLPSEDEGISLAVLEAMAAGTAIISTPAGGLAKFLEDRVDSLVVAEPDPKAFADAFQELLDNPELYVGISKSAQEKVRPLTREAWAQKLQALLSDVRSSKDGAS